MNILIFIILFPALVNAQTLLSVSQGLNNSHSVLSFSKIQMQYGATSPIISENNKVSFGRISIQFFAGDAAGISLGYAGGIIGTSISSKDDSAPGFIGFFTGFTLGNTLGVYLTGDMKYKKGAFVPTLFGSLMGSLVSDLSAVIFDSWIPFLIIPTACAIAAFYLFGNQSDINSTVSSENKISNTNLFERNNPGNNSINVFSAVIAF